MNYQKRRHALDTLSDPNSTEDQWIAALQEVLPVAQQRQNPTGEDNSELIKSAELIIGFAGAIGIAFFINCVFVATLVPENMSLFYFAAAGLAGFLKETKVPVWRGFSNGLIVISIGLSIFSVRSFPSSIITLIPLLFVAYFGLPKLKKLGTCEECAQMIAASETAIVPHCNSKTQQSRWTWVPARFLRLAILSNIQILYLCDSALSGI